MKPHGYSTIKQVLTKALTERGNGRDGDLVARGGVLDPHPDLRRRRRASSSVLPRLHDHPAGADLPPGPLLGRRGVRPPAAGPAVGAGPERHRRRHGEGTGASVLVQGNE
jgi:hypothetical protein